MSDPQDETVRILPLRLVEDEGEDVTAFVERFRPPVPPARPAGRHRADTPEGDGD